MRRLLSALAIFCVACGQSTAVEAPAEVGAPDVEDVGFEFDSGIPRCGPGPWVVYSGYVYKEWDGRKPFAGIVHSVDLCPEITTVTDERGFAAIATTRGVPYSILTAHPDLGKTASHQRNGLWSVDEDRYFIRADPTLKPLDPTKAFITVMPFARTGLAAPCNTMVGMRARVREYPDAKVRYLVDGVDVEATDPRGPKILIEGLPDGVDVTVEAELPGCLTRVNPFPADTGKVRTHLGWNTQANVEILGPIMSDAGDTG